MLVMNNYPFRHLTEIRQRKQKCSNAITLCLGLNPCDFNYKVREMRGHLIKCLENKELKMFPVHGRRQLRKKTGVKKVLQSCSAFVRCQTRIHYMCIVTSVAENITRFALACRMKRLKIVQLYFAHIVNSLTR